MSDKSIYSKIKELFGDLENYNVLEEQIDLDQQMKYFDYSKQFKQEMDEEEWEQKKDDLFKQDVALDEKKKLLIYLASREDVSAYRLLEQYVEDPDPEIRDWALLALQESRMLLKSKLLDENQVFISTGLGGKGSKLRYFIVLLAVNEHSLTDTQKHLIKEEFEYTLKKQDIEIEEMQFYDTFTTMVTLIPIDLSLKEVFKTTIKECNRYGGDFLKSNFIVTNVKKLSNEEIQRLIEEQNDDEEEEEEGDESDISIDPDDDEGE